MDHFEKHYGHKLGEDVRQQIGLATSILSINYASYKVAPRIRPTLKKIHNLQKAIDSLLPDFLEKGEAPDSDMEAILNLFSRSPEQFTLIFPAVQFEIMAHALYSLKSLCNRIENDVRDPDYVGCEENHIWNTWVVLLTLILRSANLPTEVRKDIDKQKTTSEFVSLVREMQLRMPRAMCRHRLSDGSLATAIYRARKEVPLDVEGHSLVMFMLAMIGVFDVTFTSEGLHLGSNDDR
jgi:hypothetical protein